MSAGRWKGTQVDEWWGGAGISWAPMGACYVPGTTQRLHVNANVVDEPRLPEARCNEQYEPAMRL
jgi:hypothetical protein